MSSTRSGRAVVGVAVEGDNEVARSRASLGEASHGGGDDGESSDRLHFELLAEKIKAEMVRSAEDDHNCYLEWK